MFFGEISQGVVKSPMFEARAQRLRLDRVADGLCKCTAVANGPCADQWGDVQDPGFTGTLWQLDIGGIFFSGRHFWTLKEKQKNVVAVILPPWWAPSTCSPLMFDISPDFPSRTSQCAATRFVSQQPLQLVPRAPSGNRLRNYYWGIWGSWVSKNPRVVVVTGPLGPRVLGSTSTS